MNDASEPLRLGVPLASAKVICVFVHGRGQSPEAMQENFIQHLTASGNAYVLPRAPGGSWYAARAVDALTAETRDQLAASLVQIENEIANSQATALEDTPLLLAGFSQGACLTLELALKNGPWKGAMANFTGCRVGAAADERPLSDLDGLPVYLTGSDVDPWIPVHAFAEAAAALGKARARLRTDLFPGRPHAPAAAEVAMLDAMLMALSQRKPLWQEALAA